MRDHKWLMSMDQPSSSNNIYIRVKTCFKQKKMVNLTVKRIQALNWGRIQLHHVFRGTRQGEIVPNNHNSQKNWGECNFEGIFEREKAISTIFPYEI